MKFHKAEVAYTDSGTHAEHCSICSHYVDRTTCNVVIEKISPNGWCKKFNKAQGAARPSTRLKDVR